MALAGTMTLSMTEPHPQLTLSPLPPRQIHTLLLTPSLLLPQLIILTPLLQPTQLLLPT